MLGSLERRPEYPVHALAEANLEFAAHFAGELRHLPKGMKVIKRYIIYGIVVAYDPVGVELTTPEMFITVTIQVVRARPMAPVNRMAPGVEIRIRTSLMMGGVTLPFSKTRIQGKGAIFKTCVPHTGELDTHTPICKSKCALQQINLTARNCGCPRPFFPTTAKYP